jgi:tetratricopeptide (TPR) repeat protein
VPDAEATLREALRADPTSPSSESAKRLLEFLPLASDAAKAAQSQPRIQEALKADPSYVPALMAQAAISSQRNDAAGMRTALEAAIARYPGFAPALRPLAIMLAANPGDAQKALEYGIRAQELYQDDPDLSKAVGIAAYHRRDYPRATAALSESVRKRSEDPNAQFYLGMAQAQLKRTKESKAALSKALALQPNAPFAAEAKRVLAEQK